MEQLQWELMAPKPPSTLCQSPLPSPASGADHPSSIPCSPQPRARCLETRQRVELLIHNRTLALEPHLQGLGDMPGHKPQGHGNQE